MSSLEIKGYLLNLISKVEEESVLLQIKNAIAKIISEEETDIWDELSEIQQKELTIAIEESNDEKNWVDHNDVLKNILND